jgi:hypothetical protein
MSTDNADEQEAPEARATATDEEDTSGHRFTSMGGDPDFSAQQPSVFTRATPDEDDAERHVEDSAR